MKYLIMFVLPFLFILFLYYFLIFKNSLSKLKKLRPGLSERRFVKYLGKAEHVYEMKDGLVVHLYKPIELYDGDIEVNVHFMNGYASKVIFLFDYDSEDYFEEISEAYNGYKINSYAHHDDPLELIVSLNEEDN